MVLISRVLIFFLKQHKEPIRQHVKEDAQKGKNYILFVLYALLFILLLVTYSTKDLGKLLIIDFLLQYVNDLANQH